MSCIQWCLSDENISEIFDIYVVGCCDATLSYFSIWRYMASKFTIVQNTVLSAFESYVRFNFIDIAFFRLAHRQTLIVSSLSHDDLILGTAWKPTLAFNWQCIMNRCYLGESILYIISTWRLMMCFVHFFLNIRSFLTYLLYIFILFVKACSVIDLRSPNCIPSWYLSDLFRLFFEHE